MVISKGKGIGIGIGMCALNIRFLQLFQDNKELGKFANTFFAKTFSMELTNEHTIQIETKEDYYPIGVILKHFGQSVSDFKTMDECMAAVRHLCAENRKFQGGDEKPEIIDAKYPQFSRMWFIFSLGLTKTHTQKTEKRLEGVTDLKNLAQLEQAKVFMEGMGIEDDENPQSGAQIEGEKTGELKKTLELLKLSYLAHYSGDS